MTKMKWFGCAATLFTLLGTYPLVAQTATSPVSPRGATPTHKQPCWQQAGVSQSAMQQRKQIEENTHSQIEAVCSDSSLTPQQKQQKIQQLHQEAQKQVGGLITPQQEAAIKSCRESRGEGPHMGGVHSGGPCGEMTSAGSKPQ
ncbi:MAG: hypothetical protein WBQ10_24555 [Terriglobales bacterium]